MIKLILKLLDKLIGQKCLKTKSCRKCKYLFEYVEDDGRNIEICIGEPISQYIGELDNDNSKHNRKNI